MAVPRKYKNVDSEERNIMKKGAMTTFKTLQ